jgi:hypothetical protein
MEMAIVLMGIGIWMSGNRHPLQDYVSIPVLTAVWTLILIGSFLLLPSSDQCWYIRKTRELIRWW